MARGMVNGEPVVSQANSKAYADNYERIFGKDHKPQRGRWSFGSSDDTRKALHAPIIADRIHEGTVSPIDGSDIGSRAKRRAHMRAHGVEDATDATPEWRESIKRQQEREDDRGRRAAMDAAARTLYQQGKWR
jgi:hypothetical protein